MTDQFGTTPFHVPTELPGQVYSWVWTAPGTVGGMGLAGSSARWPATVDPAKESRLKLTSLEVAPSRAFPAAGFVAVDYDPTAPVGVFCSLKKALDVDGVGRKGNWVAKVLLDPTGQLGPTAALELAMAQLSQLTWHPDQIEIGRLPGVVWPPTGAGAVSPGAPVDLGVPVSPVGTGALADRGVQSAPVGPVNPVDLELLQVVLGGICANRPVIVVGVSGFEAIKLAHGVLACLPRGLTSRLSFTTFAAYPEATSAGLSFASPEYSTEVRPAKRPDADILRLDANGQDRLVGPGARQPSALTDRQWDQLASGAAAQAQVETVEQLAAWLDDLAAAQSQAGSAMAYGQGQDTPTGQVKEPRSDPTSQAGATADQPSKPASIGQLPSQAGDQWTQPSHVAGGDRRRRSGWWLAVIGAAGVIAIVAGVWWWIQDGGSADNRPPVAPTESTTGPTNGYPSSGTRSSLEPDVAGETGQPADGIGGQERGQDKGQPTNAPATEGAVGPSGGPDGLSGEPTRESDQP